MNQEQEYLDSHPSCRLPCLLPTILHGRDDKGATEAGKQARSQCWARIQRSVGWRSLLSCETPATEELTWAWEPDWAGFTSWFNHSLTLQVWGKLLNTLKVQIPRSGMGKTLYSQKASVWRCMRQDMFAGYCNRLCSGLNKCQLPSARSRSLNFIW